MGSPLGVTFANYHMTELENKTFENNPTLEPTIYCRCVNDCFLAIESSNQLQRLIEAFRSTSVLNFTSEESLNSSYHFLDVDIVQQNANFTTNIYKKATSSVFYLHAASECPDKFKVVLFDQGSTARIRYDHE